MSEQIVFRPENSGEHELPAYEGQKTIEEGRQERLEASTERQKDISEIRAAVQENAADAPPVSLQEPSAAPAQPQVTQNSVLGKLTAERSLSHIRHNLSGGDKAFSKVIHQPVIRAASEAGARTIGRPIALLVGGICALLGSSIYLYLAKHIGFSYNYLVSTMLFTAGLLLGLILEGIFNLFTRRKKPQHL